MALGLSVSQPTSARETLSPSTVQFFSVRASIASRKVLSEMRAPKAFQLRHPSGCPSQSGEAASVINAGEVGLVDKSERDLEHWMGGWGG